MRLKTLSAVAALIAAAIAFAVEPSAGAPRAHRTKQVRPPPAQPEIACTMIGCVPVPPTCRQTYGVTADGIPTGFDVLICPPGVQPLR
jgi:hypothetical protein